MLNVKKIFEKDILYRNIGNLELVGRLYTPGTKKPAPFVVDVHGGAWGSGDRFNNQVIHQSFARNGIGVFALEFRLSSQAQFPHPVADINYGVRWFKKHAASLNIATSLIGGLGSSSGAQQIGLVALQPNEERYTVAESSLLNVDSSLDFLIACWPILDPAARYKMAKKTGKERLVDAHHSYFPTEADMMLGNPYMVLDAGAATHTPPIAVVQGEADENVDHFRADVFAELYRKSGGRIEVYKYTGQPHTFVTNYPEHPDSQEAIQKLQDFIFRLTV